MNYPNGTSVSVGDWVWWNEGTAVGRIAKIINTSLLCAAWGVNEFGVFICATNVNSDVPTCDIFYSEACMLDEGICMLTSTDKSAMDIAIDAYCNNHMVSKSESKIVVRYTKLGEKTGQYCVSIMR